MDVDESQSAVNPSGDTAFLQVRLTTKSPKFAIPDIPYSLPSSTRSSELNAIVNQYLSENNDVWNEIEFDFLIDGELLLGTLQEFVASHETSPETLLVIEYIEQIPAPKPELSIEHSDWVSAVHFRDGRILTGCYDHTVSLWMPSGSLILKNEAHLGPVKAVAFVDVKETEGTFLTASHDQTAALWSYEAQGKKFVSQPRAFFRGHAGSVDAISVNPDKQKFCSVSWDKMLKIWSLGEDMDEGVGSDGEPADKRLKVDGKKLTRVPLMTLSGHKEAVTTCAWSTAGEIITASWDHSIKVWDVELGGMSRQLDGPKAFLSISYSPLNRLVISGATDRLVRLFDPRSSEGSIVKMGFLSHMGWISSVSWSPTNEFLFISGSYDSVMKMWDTRSPKSPVYDMSGHADKILCCHWCPNDLLLSGAADNTLKIFNAKISAK